MSKKVKAVSQEQKRVDRANLKALLIHIFRKHIGRANAIQRGELFFKVYGYYPSTTDVYKTYWMMEVVRKVLQQMRSDNELFVVWSGRYAFVLQLEDELKRYEKRNRRHIKHIRKLTKNAQEWVRKGMWRNL